MRTSSLLLALVVTAAAAAAGGACSSDPASSPPEADAGTTTIEPTERDAGKAEGEDASESALPQLTEKEPNDGKTTTEIDRMALPAAMTGAIEPADDIDAFAIEPAAGELWEWTMEPKGADLAPHLTVFDRAEDTLNPTVLAHAGAGEVATLEHFVLAGGSFVAVVRDARNVPAPSGKGGPGYGYVLTARKKIAKPVVGSSRVDLQACKLEYSIVSPK